MFHFFNNKINNNDVKTNEELFYKKYGDCRKLPYHINLLVITDTHGLLAYKKEEQEKLKNVGEYDLCCVLGDVTYSDYEIILHYIKKDKIVALLGNHDGFDVLKYYGLEDLNGKTINVNGIRIGGIQGSFRYKSEDFPSFTHAESIKFLDKMEETDILLSHAGPYLNDNTDIVHNGLKGITEYLYKNRVPYNIHGHNHVNKDLCLKNGTRVIERYFIEKIHI
ncbi:MAG: metallophosphoesterase [Clostridia bacterium]|nr:metallophosphoesterase [Clostridia bacterium]